MAKKRTTPTATQVVDAEIVEQASMQLITKDGNVNTSLMSKAQKDKYSAMLKDVTPTDPTSVINIGAVIQAQMGKNGNSFLEKTRTSNSGELGELITAMVNEVTDKMDVDDFNATDSKLLEVLQKIPLIGSLIKTPIQKVTQRYATLKDSFATIEKGVDGIIKQCYADNNYLNEMQSAALAYLDNLDDTIIALTVKIEEAKAKRAAMDAEIVDPIEINEMDTFIQNLESKMVDLKAARAIGKNNVVLMRMIIQGNVKSAQNAQNVINITLPTLNQRMSLAIALDRQKKGLEVQELIRSKSGELIVSTMKTAGQNLVKAEELMSRSAIDLAAIQKSQQELTETITKIKQIRDNIKATQAEELEICQQLDKGLEEIYAATPKGLIAN